MNVSKIKSVLLGVAVGDAVGVPYEFRSREILLKNPVLMDLYIPLFPVKSIS